MKSMYNNGFRKDIIKGYIMKRMKNNINVSLMILILACYMLLGLLASSVARAQDSSKPADKWQFEITPYFLASGLNGDIGIHGVTGDVDMSFSDIWDRLDAGFMAVFEARKGPWVFSFDGQYIRLEDVKTKSWQGPLGVVSITGALEATMTQQLYQLAAGYRLIDEHTKLDLIGAMRYTSLDIDLDLTVTTSGKLFPGGTRSMSGREDWWDPVIGARVIAPFSQKWSFIGYADFGGFGVGSDFTFQAIAGIKWQFSKIVSAKLAYRYLYQDFEKDNFIWDMAVHGPVIGIGFQF
jgi:opacity protein-like surface antigen